MPHIVIDNPTAEQLEDLACTSKLAVEVFDGDLDRLRDSTDDLIIVGHGTRFLKPWENELLAQKASVVVPHLRPMNHIFAEPLPLPDIMYSIRKDGRIGRSFSELYCSLPTCVLLRPKALAYLADDATSLNEAVLRVTALLGITQAPCEVFGIPQSLTVTGLQDCRKSRCYQDEIDLRIAYRHKTISILGRNVEDLTPPPPSIVISTKYSKEAYIGDVLVCLEMLDEYPSGFRQVWGLDGNRRTNWHNNVKLVEPQVDECEIGLGPPFMCSSPELLAAHIATAAGAGSITLVGDFDNIPGFWEGILLLKDLAPTLIFRRLTKI